MRKTTQLAVTIVLAAVLAGCGGTNTLQPSPAGGASAALKLGSATLPGIAARHGTALGTHALRPNPCCVRTLFVSDPGANAVQLYQYPSGTYLGAVPQPPALSQPQGECVDATNPQHVFVANTSASTIVEYAHSGAYVMQLADPGEYPVDCAYRQTGPTSGVLAVSNIYTTSGPPYSGSISIYTNTGGVWTGPTIYNPPGTADRQLYYIDYRGTTLYIDGFHYSLQFFFMKMSQSGTFTQIALSSAPCGGINFPGGVQRIGNYLAVGDQSPNSGCPNILHVLPNGVVTGSTTLSPPPGDLVQFFHRGPRVVAPDYFGGSADIYAYPGGALVTPVSGTLVQPLGSAISHQ